MTTISKNTSRRSFLKNTGMASIALLLGVRKTAAATNEIFNGSAADSSFDFTPFIKIDTAGKITIFNTKPDIGQGVWQAIPAIVAEELGLSSLDSVEIRQTSGEKIFGPMQFAGGSMSVRSGYHDLRKVGAAAREMLAAAAAERWKISTDDCLVENGRVFQRNQLQISLGFGELVEAASKMEVPTEPKLKDPAAFKMLGKPMLRPDVPLKTNGQAVYGIDLEVPEMVFASIERCPVLGGTLLKFDDSEARKVHGVRSVERIERVIGLQKTEGVAVVADNYWAALKGRRALKIEWDFRGHEAFSSEKYAENLRQLAKTDGVIDHEQGDFEKTYAAADLQIEAFYETPLVSHSPMEPMNALAHWQGDGKMEVWASTQVPTRVKNMLAEAFGSQPENVKINMAFNGGGFGRRLYPDYILEAMTLSKTIGRPVKTIWTREDDTQQGPFRPMTFSSLKAGLSADGRAIAFQHKVIAPSLDASSNEKYDRTKTDEYMMEGVSSQAYLIENVQNRFVFAEFHVPVAAWRAVTSTTLAFAHECFIDEMAIKTGRDPLEFRLSMLPEKSDARRILEKLKAVSDWQKPLGPNRGRGVAQWEFFAGHAAHVVEVVRRADGSIKIEKVIAVIDLGTVVNPDTVRGQVEGAITMAIAAATKNGITFKNGAVEQSNFHDNPILRLPEMPPVEVHILADGGPTIKGVGEPGLPPLAPALANAIFQATGVRLRRLPFDLKKIG